MNRRDLLSIAALPALTRLEPASALDASANGQRGIDVAAYLTATELEQVNGGGTSIDLTPRLLQARRAGGQRPLYLRSGVWSFTSIDFKGYYGGLIGDGVGVTIIKARSIVPEFIDAQDKDDVIVSPFLLQNLTIDGSGLVSNIVGISHRHQYRIQDVVMQGAKSSCLKARDSWLNIHSNVRFQGAPRGAWLVGSNHRNAFYSCTFNGCSLWQIDIGSGLDGNEAILFSNCDVEFGDGAGGGVRFEGSSMSFDGYLGENIPGPVLQVHSGIVTIKGVMYYGCASSSIGVQCNGGKIFVNAKINGQSHAGFEYLAAGGAGKVVFRECLASTPLGGNQTMNGDPLGYGPEYPVFAKRLGRTMSSTASSGATFIQTISGNSITCQCTSVRTANASLSIVNPLLGSPPEWRQGEPLYLLVVYRSNRDLSVRLSASEAGLRSFELGVMPGTGDAVKTYVKLDNRVPANNYDLIEFRVDGVSTGDSFTISECIIADSRALNPGTGTFGNLYKC